MNTLKHHGGNEVDLLADYPRTKRDPKKRALDKNPEDVKIARQFGQEFFDGPRSQGYGGYRDDGRWIPVAKHIINYYGLTPGMSILDVGCAKGFALSDFLKVMPELHVAGIDVSTYAIKNSPESVRPYLQVANAKELPYPDKAFDLVISINSIHNLDMPECKKALAEIERVKSQYAFITVDAFRDKEEEGRMRMWNLTALTMLSVEDWKKLFNEVGYTGDFYWFIP